MRSTNNASSTQHLKHCGCQQNDSPKRSANTAISPGLMFPEQLWHWRILEIDPLTHPKILCKGI